MEENQTLESEVETLDGENTQAETTETQPKLYTEEEVEAIKKKMQSDSDKGVQPLIKKTKAYDKAMDRLTDISEDNTKLISLYEEDEEAAKIVLDKYYNGMNIEEFKNSIQYKEDYTDPKVIERKVALETQKRLEKITISKAKDEFISKLQMDENETRDFEEAFTERMQLKSFRIEDIEKHLEKAYREISKEVDTKSLYTQKAIADTMATGDGKGGNEPTQKKSGLQNEIADFLKNYS